MGIIIPHSLLNPKPLNPKPYYMRIMVPLFPTKNQYEEEDDPLFPAQARSILEGLGGL